MMMLMMSCRHQEDVSDHPGLVLGGGPGLQVHRSDGHRPGGQQAVPVRLPPLLLAGGRQGRPPSARQVSPPEQTQTHRVRPAHNHNFKH